MQTINISPVFKKLIWPLAPEEKENLEKSILSEGCRDAIILWGDTLVDGHNRFEICSRHNLPFKTISIDIVDELHAELWIQTNQLSRRNITDDQRAMIALSIIEKQSEIAKHERAVNAINTRWEKTDDEKYLEVKTTPKYSPEPAPPKPRKKERVRKAVSRQAKVSEMKVRAAKKLKDKNPELAEQVAMGKISLRDGTKQQADIEKEEIKKNTPEISGKYRIVYADPPWKYTSGNQHSEEEQETVLESHYQSLTIKELSALDIKSMLEPDAVLFLWTTSPLLEEAFDVIKAWGFKYKASMVWDKIKHNVGHYVSVRHEFLLICTKGSCKPDNPKLYDSVVSIERTRHSEKPEEFRNIIDSIYPEGNRVELFARKTTDGWTSWGNEANGK